MNFLLDTCCWLWWLVSPEKLADDALFLIRDSTNKVYLSAASSWEIAIKYAIGKLPLPEPPETFVPDRLARDGIFSLAIEHAHALRVANIPAHHRDPFDRLLVAQSQLEKLPLMTADSVFERYEIETIPARKL